MSAMTSTAIGEVAILHLGVVAGVLLGRHRVVLAADRVEGDRDVERGARGRALEEQVLEEVRGAEARRRGAVAGGDRIRFVAGADGDPVAERGAAGARDLLAEDADTARKHGPPDQRIAGCGEREVGQTEGEVDCAVHPLHPTPGGPDRAFSKRRTNRLVCLLYTGPRPQRGPPRRAPNRRRTRPSHNEGVVPDGRKCSNDHPAARAIEAEDPRDRRRALLPRGNPHGRRRSHHRRRTGDQGHVLQALPLEGPADHRLRRRARQAGARLVRRAGDARDADPRDIARALVDSINVEAVRPGFRGDPFINAAAQFADENHPVRVAVTAHRDWYAHRIEDLFRQIGHPRPGDAADDLILARDGALAGGYVGDPIAAGAALHRSLRAASCAEACGSADGGATRRRGRVRASERGSAGCPRLP